MEKQPNDEHVDFSDLPSLPPDEIRVLGHIIRNPDIRHSELEAAFHDLPVDEAISGQDVAAILEDLLKKRLLNSDHSGDEPTYRARMRRKTSQVMTIQGIWNALDSGEGGEPLESEMNTEMRKTRSQLANNLLADLSKEHQFTEPPADMEEARKTGASLLSDLTSAGRSAMSKRETRQPDDAGKQIIDDLANKLRKQTGIHPVVRAEGEKASLWRKLLSWLGGNKG